MFKNIEILRGNIAICFTKVSDRISISHLKNNMIDGIIKNNKLLTEKSR
jgi:hypothetical protein